jgi:hypothetical protein
MLRLFNCITESTQVTEGRMFVRPSIKEKSTTMYVILHTQLYIL